MIYLASQSPRRAELIQELNQPYQIVKSTFRESFQHQAAPEDNGMRNAWGKAKRAHLPTQSSGIVLGCDTFLYFQGQHIGKPKNLTHARRMLHSLAGQSHWVYSGLCLIDLDTGIVRKSFARTQVTFKPLTDAIIDRLFQAYDPLDKSGSYAVQQEQGLLIAGMDGSASNVMGLPLELLKKELARLT